jgi:hypothetical protein
MYDYHRRQVEENQRRSREAARRAQEMAQRAAREWSVRLQRESQERARQADQQAFSNAQRARRSRQKANDGMSQGQGYGYEDYRPSYGRRPGKSAWARLKRVIACVFGIVGLSVASAAVLDAARWGRLAQQDALAVSGMLGLAAAVLAVLAVYHFIRMIFRILANLMG